MKVTFLLTQDRGGPVDLTVGLARELGARPDGPEVSIVGPGPVCGTDQPGCSFRQAQVRSKTDVQGFAAIARLLADLKPDVVHAQDRRAGLVAVLTAGRGTPVLMTFHGVHDRAAGRWVDAGPLHRRPNLAGTIRLGADGLLARRTVLTVAPSRAIAGFLRSQLRVPQPRIQVVHNGVPIPAAPRSVGPVKTFVTVSSFAPCKATPLLVEAFLDVVKGSPGLRLLMVGDGPDRRACEELVRAADRTGQVEFTGFRTDVSVLLARADAFVLPSFNENMPLALLQAMAAGLPCIASSIGGIPEALSADSGILIAPGDGAALRAAMRRLAREPATAAGFGAAARETAATRFSLATCADRHLLLWRAIVGAS